MKIRIQIADYRTYDIHNMIISNEQYKLLQWLKDHECLDEEVEITNLDEIDTFIDLTM